MIVERVTSEYACNRCHKVLSATRPIAIQLCSLFLVAKQQTKPAAECDFCSHCEKRLLSLCDQVARPRKRGGGE